jgi:hypothetical protein
MLSDKRVAVISVLTTFPALILVVFGFYTESLVPNPHSMLSTEAKDGSLYIMIGAFIMLIGLYISDWHYERKAKRLEKEVAAKNG